MVDQVGGEHYLAEYQHWDMVADTRTGYLEGNATKYLSRWRKKNGLQDLDKALSYIVKLRELLWESRIGRNPSLFAGTAVDATVAATCLHRWFDSAKVEVADQRMIMDVLYWRTDNDLIMAIGAVQAARLAAGAPPVPAAPTLAGRPAMPALPHATGRGGQAPSRGPGGTSFAAQFDRSEEGDD